MFEREVVNEPSVFEPLKFYCIRCTFVAVFFFLWMSIYKPSEKNHVERDTICHACTVPIRLQISLYRFIWFYNFYGE